VHECACSSQHCCSRTWGKQHSSAGILRRWGVSLPGCPCQHHTILRTFPCTLCCALVTARHAAIQVTEAFYASLPGGKGLFWAMFIVATAAAIVASQALISATFAIVSQV
jgi:K+ potassium transporter